MRVLTSTVFAINAFFLAVVLRQCSIVHGDGPNGFGEFILKGLLAHTSIASFGFLAFSLWHLSKESKGKLGVFFVALIASTVLLLSFLVSLIDACENEKGHCRRWSLVTAHRPNNSFKPSPLRGLGRAP